MKNLLKFGCAILIFLAAISFTSKKKTNVIDAGHGGNDIGATKLGVNEKDIALQIAQKVKNLNKNSDLEIILTRDSDDYISLAERSKIINEINPDVLISLHINFSPKNEAKSGHEVYYKDDQESKNLAERFAKNFGNARHETQNLYLLKNSKSPAIILEMGYLSNEKDRAYLLTNYGQKEIVEKILATISQ